MTLIQVGLLIQQRYGDDAALRWRASLTSDQQTALTAELDQLGAAVRDFAAGFAQAVGELGTAMQSTGEAFERAARTIEAT